ncbi:MAG: ribosomal protein S18-alanine N-acetyltransferase [Thermodesulfobacteriota bacterium]
MTGIMDITQGNCESYLDAIMEIERLSFPTPWSRNAFVQELKNPVSHLWALLEGGALLGYMCFWMFDSEIQLINVAVHPEKRGRGLGLFLMEKMIETGVANGMHKIWLEVRTSNLRAQRLYDKLGFVTVGRRRLYYRDTNEDAIVMSLSLAERPTIRKVAN